MLFIWFCLRQYAAKQYFEAIKKAIWNDQKRPKKEKKKGNLNHFVFSELDKMIVPEQIPSALSTKNIQKRIEVPNVLGKSVKKAIAILSNAGLKVKVNGSGQVIEQFPKPGRLSKNSKLCILTLKWEKN